MLPDKLNNKIRKRKNDGTERSLSTNSDNKIDFCSNDYLGFSKSEDIFDKTHQRLIQENYKKNGATGSRLISGNHRLFEETEKKLANMHQVESALFFNSGYTANLGLLSCVPQRNDFILYDEYIHTSIRDGIQLSNAKAYKFKHNSYSHLEELLKKLKNNNNEIYVVTESVFSMDGDSPDIKKIYTIVETYQAHLIVDEAHAVGVFGLGLVQKLHLQDKIFARIITFGKALGSHGGAILSSSSLRNYLINFSRPFIYTTGCSPHNLATIETSYNYLINDKGAKEKEKLKDNINHFLTEVTRLKIKFINSSSAIQSCIIGGNEKTKQIAEHLQKKNFYVKGILSPTVPKGTERLRFCMHSYNSKKEITNVLQNLATFV